MSDELFRLDGKVAVVTGGGRGIGVMIARGLLQAGARVYLVSRKPAELDAAAAALSVLGPVRTISADLSAAAGADGLAARLGDVEDTVHVLFNNAGTAWEEPFDAFPQSGFDKVMATNVSGVFFVTRALLPFLRAGASQEDPARVINTGSVDGIRTPLRGRNNFSYSASKAAVHMLTRHLAGELAPTILVNAIAAGPFESRMTAKLIAANREAVEHYVPLGRIGRPDDMAGMAVFLASRASSWITGTVIQLDGGLGSIG